MGDKPASNTPSPIGLGHRLGISPDFAKTPLLPEGENLSNEANITPPALGGVCGEVNDDTATKSALIKGNSSRCSNSPNSCPPPSTAADRDVNETRLQTRKRVRFSRVQGKGICLHYELDNRTFSSCARVTFSTPSAQKDHVYLHVKPWECSTCFSKWNRRKNFLRHSNSKSCKPPEQGSPIKKRPVDEQKRMEWIVAAKDWDEIRRGVHMCGGISNDLALTALDQIIQEPDHDRSSAPPESSIPQGGIATHQITNSTLSATISLLETRCRRMEDILSNWDQLTARVKSLEEDIARLENQQHGPPNPFSGMHPTVDSFPGIPQADWSALPNSIHAEETRSTVDPSEILQSFQNCYTEGGPANVQVHDWWVLDSLPFTSPSLFTQTSMPSDTFGKPPTSPLMLQGRPPPKPEGIASGHDNPDSELLVFNPRHNLSQAQFPSSVSSRGSGDTASLSNCDICGRTFRRKADMNRHRESMHGRAVYCCSSSGCKRSVIEFGFTRKDKLVDHSRRVHPTSPQT